MARLIFLILFFLQLMVCKAQDPMFSQFMFQQLYYNPAHAGISDNPRLMGGYRNQWPGMDNAFSSFYVSYDQKLVSINSGLGVAVSKDFIGDNTYNATNIDLCYNYHFAVTKEFTTSLGLQVGIYQKARNTSGLTLPDQSPYGGSGATEVIANNSIWYPDFSLGAYLSFPKKQSLSIAIHHLNRPNTSLAENGVNRIPFRITAQYFKEFYSYIGKFNNEPLLFKPGIMFQKHGPYNYSSLGCNVMASSIIGGLWLRNDMNFTLESFTLLIGYINPGFRLTYSYDMRLLNFSKNVINNAAHEVTFQINFQYNERKKMRAVKCPKF